MSESSEKVENASDARRRILNIAVSTVLMETGFDAADKMSLETLTEMLQCFLTEVGNSAKGYCELSGRVEPVLGDVYMSLINMGINLQGLEQYAARPNRHIIQPPQQAPAPKTPAMLSAGSKAKPAPHIPCHFPALPDPHAYIRTPTHKQPVTEYEAIREKAATQKRDIEKALTKFLAKTSETHNLFNTEDNQVFPCSHKVLHGFPHPEHEKDRFNTWLYAVGLDILGLENERIYKYRRVCRSHFAEKYLCRNNRLSKTAVPTLNMPGLSLQTPIFMEQKPMRKVLHCLQPSTSTAPTPPNFGEHINLKSMAHEERKCSEEDKVSEKENCEPAVATTPILIVPTQPPPVATRDVLTHCEPVVPTTSNLNVPTKPPPVAMRDVLPHYVSKRTLKIKPVLTAKENLVHSMVIAAKRKISKLKKKVKQQSAQIKAAAKLASNPVVLEVLENSTSNAKKKEYIKSVQEQLVSLFNFDFF